MQHILTIFNKNTHTCERSAFEIVERNNFQDNFIDTLSSFTRKNSQERKQILTKIDNGECLHLFSIWNTLGIHRTIFQRYHPGLL